MNDDRQTKIESHEDDRHENLPQASSNAEPSAGEITALDGIERRVAELEDANRNLIKEISSSNKMLKLLADHFGVKESRDAPSAIRSSRLFGFTVVTVKRSTSKFDFRIISRLGSRFEQDETFGITHYLEHCLADLPSKRYPTREAVVRGISMLRSVNGQTNQSVIELNCIGDVRRLEHGLDFLLSQMFYPIFNESLCKKERSVVLNEVEGDIAGTSGFAGPGVTKDGYIFDNSASSLQRLLFAGHQVGDRSNVFGVPSSVKKFDTRDLQLLHDYFIRPENSVLVLESRLDHDAVVEIMQKKMRELDLDKYSVMKPRPKSSEGVLAKINFYVPFIPKKHLALNPYEGRVLVTGRNVTGSEMFLSLMFTDDPSAPFSHAELELFESLIGESDPNSLVYGELRRQGLSYDSEITLFHNYEPGVHILQIRFSALTKKDLKRSLSVLRTVLANIAEGEFVDAWVLGWAKETTVHRLDAAAQSPIDDSPVLPRVYDIIEREGIPALLDAEIKVTTGDAVASVKTDDLARLARAILESPKIAVHFDGPDANKSSKLRENQTLIDRTFSLSSKKRARR